MVTSSRRAYAAPKAPAPATGHCWPVPLQGTLKPSSVSVSVGSLGLGAHKVCLSPLSVSGGYGVWSKHNSVSPTILLFQILKGDAVKVLHSICQQIWKTQQWPQDWKRSIFVPIPKKGNVKECSNYCMIALILYTSKVMLKILQLKLEQYVNHELQMFKLDLEKAEKPEIKLPTSPGSSKKQLSSWKNLLLFYWLCQSHWLCGSQQTGKILKEMGILKVTRPPDLPADKSVCRSRSNS